MTPKQILDSFSETLLQDERILSEQERAFIGAILRHANATSGANEEAKQGVRSVLASSVGEIVAQRAFAVLGGSMVERILQQGSSSPSVEGSRPAEAYLGPQPPTSPKPPTPRIPPGPQPPAQPQPAPGVPAPGPAPGPQPPHPITGTVISKTNVRVAERPDRLPARCVVLDEFLAPQEVAELIRFTVDHESDFQTSEVLSPESEGGVVDYEHRSSRVLVDLGKYQDLVLGHIETVLPEVLQKLGMEDFRISGVEAQITASNDGDFFRFHSDNGGATVASRYLTFVYFVHREPCGFEGGELRIHDARLNQGMYVSEGTYQSVIPRQNQIVFFPCELLHEITPVRCRSRLFADSRFTLNGWLRR